MGLQPQAREQAARGQDRLGRRLGRAHGPLAYLRRRGRGGAVSAWLPHYECRTRKVETSLCTSGCWPSAPRRSTACWPRARPGPTPWPTAAAAWKGNFLWSVTYTDLRSGWTCNRAVWNKGAHGIMAATREIKATLPFELLGFDIDHVSEFF